MGVKVKCEHCWKIFEVPDDAINKQRQCHFCQRSTFAKPLIEEASVEKVPKDAPEEFYPFMKTTILIVFILSLINFFFLFRGTHQEDRIREIFQETPEWQNNIQNAISKMEQKIKDYEQILLQNKIQPFTPETLAIDLIRSMESSLKLLNERITRQKNTLKELEDKINAMQLEMQRSGKTLEKKNEKR